ncbi:FIST signal transduction protein [Marinobacter nanhaiticus D15-8W]|uniref:GfdT protein n=2 Tax=Marinobacter TaxID=2742 RepID=N6X452_9GAMM|nr:GfdT protein [Marinobacter nanhaiticus D15-8W]BES73280.1 FIST signal transduction protein [Marinobacter nanhaiticus D15-8W]
MAYVRFRGAARSTEVELDRWMKRVESEWRISGREPSTMLPVTSVAPVRIASSDARDPQLAATSLASQLHHADLACVLFFCSAEYDLARLGIALEHVFPAVPLTGCTSAGEITPLGYGRGCITAIGFDRRYFSVDCALIGELEQFSLQDAQGLVDNLLATFREASLAPVKGHTFAITLLDGLSSREELVLATLNAALGSIPHFGGSAGDDERLANTHVYFQGRFHNRAAIVLMINTSLAFRVFSTHHMLAGEDKLVVTRASSESRTVYELNAEPAAVAYARAAGVTVAELDRRVFALRPMAVRIGDQYFVRSVQRVNDDGSLTFYCAVETGIVLTAMRPGPLLANLKQQLENAEQEVGPPLLTIGCDCFLRRLEAEFSGFVEEASDFLVDHRVIGFNTYGEQFDGMHINQTFTGVVIGQPAHDQD